MITLNGHEVKVGDRLWSALVGDWVLVTSLRENGGVEVYPISALLERTGESLTYTQKGQYFDGGCQVLFWDKIELGPPPPKPKRKVKKWHALIKVVNGSYGLSQEYYSSLGEAQAHYATIWRQAIRLIPETEQEFDE